MKIKNLLIKLNYVTVILLALLLSCFSAKSSVFEQKYRVWDYWNVRDENSIRVVDHSKWQKILNMYLYAQHDSTLFNYDDMVDAREQFLVQDYIDLLKQEDPTKLNSYEQLAYWINLYNALIVNLILSKYPVKSILEIKPNLSFSSLGRLFSFFRYGPWDNKVVNINGIDLSMNDIANQILLPIWGDRRIHYCLCNGSMGSPDLYPVVFTAIEMPKLLKSTANRFIQQEKAMQWIDGRLVLSRVFNNSNDFYDRNALLSHLKKYNNLANKRKLANYHGTIDYQFDWRLNKLTPRLN